MSDPYSRAVQANANCRCRTTLQLRNFGGLVPVEIVFLQKYPIVRVALLEKPLHINAGHVQTSSPTYFRKCFGWSFAPYHCAIEIKRNGVGPSQK